MSLKVTRAVEPVPSTDSAAFWNACDEERLLLRYCDACGEVSYYPRLSCPLCGSRELHWVQAAGTGSVYSHTTVFTSFYGPDWEDDIPYVVLLVDLDEGPRMLSRLVGDPSELRVGAAVIVTFTTIGDRRYPYFRLSEEPSR